MNLTPEEKELLYGWDETPNIVGVESVPGKENVFQVFQRNGDKVTSYYSPIKFSAYVNDEEPSLHGLYDAEMIELSGDNFYNRRVQTTNKMTLSWLRKNANKVYIPPTTAQYFITTGTTMFKDMTFDSPLRCYLDIETLTSPGYEFPNSQRYEDKVIVVSMLFNHTYAPIILALNEDGKTPQLEHVYLYKTEKELLEALTQIIVAVDVDILVTHNGFRFDFPYLKDRYALHDLEWNIGRNGFAYDCRPSKIKFAERDEEYDNPIIYGRSCIDTYFLARKWDIVHRKMDNYQLKSIVKALGKADEDRTYIEGKDLSKVWRGEHSEFTREDLLNYALDDVKETQILDKTFGQRVFYETQMIPLPLQDVFRYGTGTKIDLMLVRQYFKANVSLPKPDDKRNFPGAYTGVGKFGLTLGRLIYMDVASLYPTMRKVLGIKPPKDILNVYETVCDLLTVVRFEYKTLMKKYKGVDDSLYEMYDAMQNTAKILINTSNFGYISWEHGLFNYYDGGEAITTNGKQVMNLMIESNTLYGAQVLKFDTDGMLVLAPDWVENEQDEIDYIKNWIEPYVNENFKPIKI